jgi:hypothetical protein
MAGLAQSVGSGATTGAAVGSAVPGIGTLVGTAAGAAVGLGSFLWNKHKAEKDALNRPTYTPPEEVGNGLAFANQMAMQGTPEQILQQGRTQDYRAAAFGLGQTSSRKGGLAGVAALNQNLMDSEARRMAQSSADQFRNQQNLYGQLENVANHKDQAWELNQLNPYQLSMQRSSANRGALYQNLNKSIQLGGQAYDGMNRSNSNNSGSNSYFTPDNSGQSGMFNYQGGSGIENNPGLNFNPSDFRNIG